MKMPVYDDELLAADLRNRHLVREVPAAAVERFCSCDEVIVNGKRLPCPRFHDCAYIRQRSALVSEAVRIANRIVTPIIGDKAGKCRWNSVFGEAMEKLAAPLLQGRNGDSSDSSAESSEDATTDDDLREEVKPSEVMTVPLIA